MYSILHDIYPFNNNSFGLGAEAILQWKRQPSILDGDIIGLLAYDTPFYSVNHRFVTSQAVNHAETLNRHVSRFWTATSTAATSTGAATRSATSATRAAIEYPSTATNATKKSSSSSWGLLAGVVGVAAAGAAAYMAREKITESMTDAFAHLEFVSTLMDLNGCWER